MDFYLWLEGQTLSTWVRESPAIWGYPTILMLHTLGMAVLVGTSAVVSLRVIGVGRTIPLAPLRGLFPVVWAGGGLSFATGALLFGADASTRGTQGLFFAKLAIVATGIVTVALTRRHVFGEIAEPAVVSQTARRLAFVSLLAWVAAITAGRLLAYVE
ncbi:MAG: hypothetical protein O2930_01730 [Acidobacteria bacterium]|nr:hypothetical protein [Acidobacteriota bacterium]